MAENCLPFPEALGIPGTRTCSGLAFGWLPPGKAPLWGCGPLPSLRNAGLCTLALTYTGSHWRYAFFWGGGFACFKTALDSESLCKGILILTMGSFMERSNETFQLGFIYIPLLLTQENPLQQCHCSQVPPKRKWEVWSPQNRLASVLSLPTLSYWGPGILLRPLNWFSGQACSDKALGIVSSWPTI